MNSFPYIRVRFTHRFVHVAASCKYYDARACLSVCFKYFFLRIKLLNIVFVSVLHNIRDEMRNRRNVWLYDVSSKSRANKQSPKRTPTHPTLSNNFNIIFLHNFGRVSKKKRKGTNIIIDIVLTVGFPSDAASISVSNHLGGLPPQSASCGFRTAYGCRWCLLAFEHKIISYEVRTGTKILSEKSCYLPNRSAKRQRKSGTKCAESNFGFRWGTRGCISYNTIFTMQYRCDTIEYKSEIAHTHTHTATGTVTRIAHTTPSDPCTLNNVHFIIHSNFIFFTLVRALHFMNY